MEKKNDSKEIFVRNILIFLTFVSLIIMFLNITMGVYSEEGNFELLNDFLIKYINGPLVWIDNLLVYLFAIIYIVFAIKSKKEVTLKISFSVVAILTTMISVSFIMIFIAQIFGIL